MILSGSNIFQRLQALTPKVREAAERGLALATERLLADTMMESPSVPHDQGTLRSSGKASISKSDSNEIVGTVSFNTPYAARLHEHPEYNFTSEGTGGKYLETPLTVNQDRYFKIVSGAIRSELAGGAP